MPGDEVSWENQHLRRWLSYTRNTINFELFVVSFLSLYFEMLCIRFIPSQIPIIGYYTNLILIACFLGLGVGCLLTWWRIRLLDFFPGLLLMLIIFIIKFKTVNITGSSGEIIFLDNTKPYFTMNMYSALSLFYIMTSLCFIPLGQEIGRLMKDIEPIIAYSVNIIGSIIGIAVFFIFSFLSLEPVYWMLICMPLIVWIYRKKKYFVIVNIMLLVITTVLIYYQTREVIWSPYHKITIGPLRYGIDEKTGEVTLHRYYTKSTDHVLPERAGFNVSVNDKTYQTPLDLSEESVREFPFLKVWKFQYDFPYQYTSKDDVLIVGGGTGNDAAAALRNGARHVDVVEIDPSLIKLGLEKHPENPYSDSRVTLYIDDARSYFHKTRKKYDVIVFGYLDSHAILSSMSNARMDSFVYTVESFQEAQSHLKENGIIVISFASSCRYIAERLCLMLRLACGTEPILSSYRAAGVNILGGRGLDRIVPHRPIYTLSDQTRVTTDDWPFFYLEKNFIPREYLITLILIVLISAIIVYFANRLGRYGVNAHFFLLGSAFMLLETKSITSLALLFGSTWIINLIVIIFILIMILLANIYSLKVAKFQVEFAYLFLGITILLNYFVPLRCIHFDSLYLRIAISGLMISSPMFFAGLIFAQSFKKTASPDYSLGSNILGGVVGGVLEYQSMVTGFNFLFILIFLLYFLSYLVLKKR